MASDKKGSGKIWKGPGVLRPGPNADAEFKKGKPLSAGEEIPVGFVGSERLKQLVAGGSACTLSEYAKHGAAGGVVDINSAAEQIGQLKELVSEQAAVNKTLQAEKEELSSRVAELEGRLAEFEAVAANDKGKTESDKDAGKGGK